MNEIQIGQYEHYKGKRYEVLGVVRHSETNELLVLYKALYKGDFPEDTLWVRPLSMFKEHVSIEGKRVLRFRYLGITPQ
jgi:hypothetical protein